MTVLLPWFALVVTVLAGWAIIKKIVYFYGPAVCRLGHDQLCRDLRCSRFSAEGC